MRLILTLLSVSFGLLYGNGGLLKVDWSKTVPNQQKLQLLPKLLKDGIKDGREHWYRLCYAHCIKSRWCSPVSRHHTFHNRHWSKYKGYTWVVLLRSLARRLTLQERTETRYKCIWRRTFQKNLKSIKLWDYSNTNTSNFEKKEYLNSKP